MKVRISTEKTERDGYLVSVSVVTAEIHNVLAIFSRSRSSNMEASCAGDAANALQQQPKMLRARWMLHADARSKTRRHREDAIIN